MPEKSDIQYIFVHGLSGWGSYDKVNRYFPYWGMRNGGMMRKCRIRPFYQELLQMLDRLPVYEDC